MRFLAQPIPIKNGFGKDRYRSFTNNPRSLSVFKNESSNQNMKMYCTYMYCRYRYVIRMVMTGTQTKKPLCGIKFLQNMRNTTEMRPAARSFL